MVLDERVLNITTYWDRDGVAPGAAGERILILIYQSRVILIYQSRGMYITLIYQSRGIYITLIYQSLLQGLVLR